MVVVGNWKNMLNYILLALALLGGVAAVGNQWQTLNGSAPIVIARGGYSGLFPEASEYAFQSALSTSFHNVVLFCDLQLTKDGQGICQSDIRLDNSTNIATVYPEGGRTYAVNGQSVRGWFSVDFTSKQLFTNVTLNQNIFSRPSLFDGTLLMSNLDNISGLKPAKAKLWLNVEYDTFFKQHKLYMGAFVLTASKRLPIDYLSSPEIDFLKGIKGKLPKAKLVLRFLDANVVEPTTRKSYGEILKDLKTIKTFASGILVPKSYIWPTNKDNYLLPHTNLVADAHAQDLEVYASGFANDVPGSFNYSYDPTMEYLQFVDNSEFSVDGVLTDFPSTASEAIGCLAHNKNKSAPAKGRPIIITHNGASGMYAGSTDLAYQKAVEDGADILDCSIQLSKDGVPFCLNSADLMGVTTAMTSFMSHFSVVPEIQQNSGIFTFDLTWACKIECCIPGIKERT